MKAIGMASLESDALSSQKESQMNGSNNDEFRALGSTHALTDMFDNGMVEYLLSYDPDIRKSDRSGKTALDWAKLTGNSRACQLLEARASANALHRQVSSNREDRILTCVDVLKRHEELAECMGNFLRGHGFNEQEFVSFLRSAKINLDDLNDAVQDIRKTHTDVTMYSMKPLEIKTSVEAFYFINRETKEGWTPLTKAASNGYLGSVQALLEMGAILHHETRLRHTAMTWACYSGHEAVCLHLLRIGVNILQKTREGKTALFHAVNNSQPRIVHHLLNALHERSIPTTAKDSFDAEVSKLNRLKTFRKMTPPSTVRPVQAEQEINSSRLEWHESFDHIMQWKDGIGNTVLECAESIARDLDAVDHPAHAVLSQLKRAITSANDHLEYIKKNEDRTKLTKCRFEGCFYTSAKDVLPIHENHHCPKRLIACESCSEMIVYEAKMKHDDAQCIMRVVACTNLQFGCQEQLSFKERDAHVYDHCRKRLMECRLLCGQTMCFDELDTHETTQCPLRIVSCPLQCTKTFRANESKRHQRKDCIKRLVPCAADDCGGCGMQVVLENMALHLNELCEKRKMTCKYENHGCEQKTGGSMASRRHHEDLECPYRFVSCRNDCGLSDQLISCFLEEHYKWQCPLEKKACPNDCSANLPAHLLSVHTLDAGDCPNRLTRCRLDLCGKQITLFDGEKKLETMKLLMSSDRSTAAKELRSVSLHAIHGRLKQSMTFIEDLLHERLSDEAYSREFAEAMKSAQAREFVLQWLQELQNQLKQDVATIQAEKYGHSRVCRVLTFSTTTKNHLLEFGDGHSEWISLDAREYIINAEDCGDRATHFLCNRVRAELRDTHEVNDCPLRLLPCPLHCGQRLPEQAMPVHCAKRCNMRNAVCRLGCGAIMPFQSLGEHEDASCALRSVFCEYCHESVRWQAIESHLERTCTQRPRRCRLGCKARIPWTECPAHEANDCPKRLVECTKCMKSIWVQEQAAHVQDECPWREYGPCDLGCGRILTHRDRAHHLIAECSQRQVRCPLCHECMAFAAVQGHKENICSQRFIYCRRGCGELIKGLDEGSREDGQCIKRIVFCANRCGDELPLCDMDQHIQASCTMRVIECPRGCRELIFAYQLETHWKRCAQRIVPCGAGAKPCARPLRAWMTNKKLGRCAAHNENALLAAIKSHDDALVNYFVHQVDGNSVDEEFSNGFTPLSMAAALKDIEIIKILLRAGADVNIESSRGRTPLSEACLAGDLAIVQLLIENRASVSHINRHGRNLLDLVRTLAPSNNVHANQIASIVEKRALLERDQRDLFIAIGCSDYDHIASLLRYCGVTAALAGSTSDPLEQLQQAVDAKEKQCEAVKAELEDSIRLFSDSVADTESKNVQAKQLSNQVDDCKSQIQQVEVIHEASMAESNALEADMLRIIREITAQDIAKLLNANVPPEGYLVVMKSICLFCGVMPRGRRNATEYTDMEWWKTAQALLMDRSLLQRLRGYRKHVISSDVMAKARRECMRTPAFAASSVEVAQESEPTSVDGDGAVNRARIPPVDVLRGNIVGTLATWVKGVEIEYKARAERQTLGERKRRLAVSLSSTRESLQRAVFEMQVANRSLPARQEEVASIRAKAEAADKERDIAQQRLRAFELLRFTALSGHTPLTFACAIGNEAIVHMLLTHGATCGYDNEERSICASFIQLIVRDFLHKKKQQQRQRDEPNFVVKSRSDEAVDALVRNVAHTFLMRHFVRKLAFFRRTHRVALHEAVVNGFPQIAEILLSYNAHIWQKTHVLPQRSLPAVIPSNLLNSAEKSSVGGWQLYPLGAPSHGESKADAAYLEPMALLDTLEIAMAHYECRTYRQGFGWGDQHQTFYDDMRQFLQPIMSKATELRLKHKQDVLARKQIAKKAAERKSLHALLHDAIVDRDFSAMSKLLDQGAFADYETPRGGFTPLMAACVQEIYVANADKHDVLAVEFLMDRPASHPFVNYESSKGWTALMTSAYYGTVKCAQALIDRGASINLRSRKAGETALMIAAANGQIGFIRFLLAEPALDVFMQDANGKTALAHAQAHGFQDTMSLLGAAMGGHRGRVVSSVNGLYGVCKWGCGFMTTMDAHCVQNTAVVKDTHPLDEHEQFQCAKRRIRCPQDCEITDLWAENLTRHLERECSMRIVRCDQSKCGAECTFKHLKTHQTEECDFRIITCACDEMMTHQRHVVHAQSQCPMRLVRCPLLCETSSSEADAGCQDPVFVLAKDLKLHLRAECHNRMVRCRNGCSANELAWKDRAVHEAKVCPLRRVACKWNCQEPVLAKMQVHHEQEECLLRELACTNRCGVADVLFLELEQHVTTTCPRRLTLCTLGCGRKVPLHNMEAHCARECRRRFVSCALCSERLPEDDMSSHLTTSCPQRLSVCGLCGQTNVVHALIPEHRAEQCRMRPVTCRYECFVKNLRAHAKDHHEQFECTFRPIWCPLGCGETIVASTLKRHEKSCSMRFVSCANGCGLELRERERVMHEQLHCPLTKRRG